MNFQELANATATPTPAFAPPEIVPIPDLSVKGRFGPRWWNRIKAVIGLPAQRRLARAALQIEPIRHWEEQFSRLSDAELRQQSMKLRSRARGGESLNRLLPEAFGLVCVAAARTLRLRPFDVQLAAGVVLHDGALAELATGEGKTLVAAMPAYLNALTGKGVHVTTVNDYLAKRDAEWIGPIYQSLGLTVGVLQQKIDEPQRRAAYQCDITYGTASELGFDFLRDRLKLAGGAGQGAPFWTPWTAGLRSQPLDPRVQRKIHHFALVDEADSIFIDDAKTPLIVAEATRLASKGESIVYYWADQLARQMKRDEHFIMDEKKQKLELTDEGRRLIRYSKPPVGAHSHAMDKLHEHVERALHAHHRFRRDQHYLVGRHDKDYDEVIIIDEGTGRIQPDRKWTEGLHEAVQAKEGVPITKGAGQGDTAAHAAKITLQRYFRLYDKLAGMTGTAAQNWREIRRVYKIRVVCVPTNRPCIREVWPDRVFPTEEAKFDAAVEEIVRLHEQGRPVLVGTRTVAKSEILSERLTARGIPHEVLNAKPKHLEREAKIVELAGQRGQVTIATNMAGRGTDIRLGPGVAALGGLHVLGLERHDAIRIDRQLAGRAARQGDPGSCQFFLSLEDELLEGLGPVAEEYLEKLGRSGRNLDWQRFHKFFVKAQRRIERRHHRQRVDLMMYEKNRQETLKDLGADPYVE